MNNLLLPPDGSLPSDPHVVLELLQLLSVHLDSICNHLGVYFLIEMKNTGVA